MTETFTSLNEWLRPDRLQALLTALAVLLAGWALGGLIGSAIRRGFSRSGHPHPGRLLSRFVTVGVTGAAFLGALHQLGINPSVLLGAAGILTVAVGFASQTSASNLISGLFLMLERPFKAGDVIRIGTTTGEVLSVDALSVKLRTFDNLYVRIPNESMIKSEMTNLTHFPIRRFDLKMGVAYHSDLAEVRQVLFEVADRNPLCLDEPKPLFIFLGFGDSALEFQFSVWAAREHWLDLRNSIAEEIKAAFDAAGIEIPFPHRTLYTGSQTEPLPVELIGRR